MPKAKKIKLHHPGLKRDHEVETESVAAQYEKRGWKRQSDKAASAAKSGEGDKA